MSNLTRKTIKMVCSYCAQEQLVDALTLEARAKYVIPMPCIGCGMDMYRFGQKVVQENNARENQKISRKQEKRIAAREGGRRQPASGSRDGYKADVRVVGKYRGECKVTRASSYRLKLQDLENLSNQAGGGELPVFEIEFLVGAPKRFCVLPEWVYETLMQESGRRPG